MKTDRNTQNAVNRIRELARSLRRDVETVVEPEAQALLETSAEVLGGLIKAFDEYKVRRAGEREREEASARPQSAKPAPRRRRPKTRSN